MMNSAVQALRRAFDARRQAVERNSVSHLRVYRAFCALAGILVVGFWFPYNLASDTYVDPLWIRVLLGIFSGILVASSYRSDRIAATFDRWVFGNFCVLGVWFVGLSAANDFATDYAVGLLFVIAAISLALSLTTGPRSRLLAFQCYVVAALGLAVLLTQQDLLSHLVLFCCVIGMVIVTGIGSTVRARMEEARAEYRDGLSEANRRAEELLHLKSAFINNMNHEIRTPLTGILGYSEILAENADPTYRECARVIRSSGERLMETLSTILDLASLEAGEFDLYPERVDLGVAVEDALNLLRFAAEKRGLSVDVRSESEPVIARGDHAAVRRVVYNLLSNAIKFTAEGSIVVRTFHTDGSACVEIADTGIGISPEFVPDLFHEFKQASSGLGRTHEGTGLGLALSKRLADLMNGHINVYSVPGAGSTFVLSLPVYLSHLKTAAA